MEKDRCIVVDDEPAAHYVLVNYIERSADLELVAQCYNAFEALEYLRNNTVDLIFLDIDMPEITGMEFLRMLDSPPKTILTTAYSEYALESYDYGVVDYLDRKSTRLNSSHVKISYAVFCLKKKKNKIMSTCAESKRDLT